jgi:hypothetical protein
LSSIANQGSPGLAGRVLSALPDGVTAFACLVVWIAPRVFGDDAVKTLLLMMVMEFILVHATGFFTASALATDATRMQRIGPMLGLALVYMLFVCGFAYAFRAWWPLTVFLWLLVGKIAWVFANPRNSDDEKARQMSAWAFSVVAYIGAVFAGLMLPLPRLGLDAATVATLRLPASGEWITYPHKAIASAVLYYAALAAFKGRSWTLPTTAFEDA